MEQLELSQNGPVEHVKPCLDSSPISSRQSASKPPWTLQQFSIDLVEAAKFHYDFIQQIDFLHPQLYDPGVVVNAVRRYEQCWLRLKRKHPYKQLVPPIDAHWLWHLHMLDPDCYAMDCHRIVGDDATTTDRPIIDRPFTPMMAADRFRIVEEQTRELWEAEPEFCGEPYDFHPFLSLSSNSSKPCQCNAVSASVLTSASLQPIQQLQQRISEYKQISTFNFLAAAQLQQEFNYQTSFPHFKCEPLLERAVRRYRCFVYLQKTYPEISFSCAPDIEIIWHTHMTHPQTYAKDMVDIGLRNLMTLRNFSTDDPETVEKTERIWRDTFAEAFSVSGCLYKTWPNPKGVAYFAPTKRWEDFDATYRITAVQMRGNSAEMCKKLKLSCTLHTENARGVKTEAAKFRLLPHEECSKVASVATDVVLNCDLLGSPLLVIIRNGSRHSSLNLTSWRRQEQREFRARCNVRQFLPTNMFMSTNAVSLRLYECIDGTLCPSESTICLQAEAQSVAEFDMLLYPFETRKLAVDDPLLYEICRSAALYKPGFNDCGGEICIAEHILSERRTARNYLCKVSLSASAVLAQILISSAEDLDRILVSAQLIGAENLPTTTSLGPLAEERKLCFLEPDERAIVVRNKYGDFAVIRAKWRRSSDHKYAPRRSCKKRNGLEMNGNAFWSSNDYLSVHVQILNRTVSTRSYSLCISSVTEKLQFGGLSHAFHESSIRVQSNWVLENVAITLTIGLLFNLCQPYNSSFRGPTPERAICRFSRSTRNNNGQAATFSVWQRLLDCSLMAASGSGAVECPSNRYFAYCAFKCGKNSVWRDDSIAHRFSPRFCNLIFTRWSSKVLNYFDDFERNEPGKNDVDENNNNEDSCSDEVTTIPGNSWRRSNSCGCSVTMRVKQQPAQQQASTPRRPRPRSNYLG